MFSSFSSIYLFIQLLVYINMDSTGIWVLFILFSRWEGETASLNQIEGGGEGECRCSGVGHGGGSIVPEDAGENEVGGREGEQGELGKNKEHSVLKNRDKEGLGGLIFVSRREFPLISFCLPRQDVFWWRQ